MKCLLKEVVRYRCGRRNWRISKLCKLKTLIKEEKKTTSWSEMAVVHHPDHRASKISP